MGRVGLLTVIGRVDLLTQTTTVVPATGAIAECSGMITRISRALHYYCSREVAVIIEQTLIQWCPVLLL